MFSQIIKSFYKLILPKSPPKAIAKSVNEKSEPQNVDIKVNNPIKIIEKLYANMRFFGFLLLFDLYTTVEIILFK